MTEETTKPAFRVRNFIDAEQLKSDLNYSLTDLSTPMMQQAALFVHYGTLAARASKQVDDLKMLLEVAESKVYRKLRDTAASEGAKVTEAQLEKSVSVHEKVVEIKRALNEAKQIEAIAKTATEGFRHRKDMLVQAGVQAREEMKGELSISRRNVEEERIETTKSRILDNIKGKRETLET